MSAIVGAVNDAEGGLHHLRQAVAIQPELVETHPELRELLAPPG